MGCRCNKRGKRRSANKRSVVAVQSFQQGMLCPMWVIRVSDFLAMEGPLLFHQQLRSKGKLVEWEPGMFCVFVCHQWVSNEHPDPEGEQAAALKGMLTSVIEGTRNILPDVLTQHSSGVAGKVEMTSTSPEFRQAIANGFLWLDWFSIPQLGTWGGAGATPIDMQNAVSSIPAYVGCADLFVALCPTLIHKDTKAYCDIDSWAARGWIRTEVTCRALSLRSNTEILVVRSATQYNYAARGDWLYSVVGEGKFTVESDRELLYPLIAGLVDNNIEHARAQGNDGLFRFRFFTAMRCQLLSGLMTRQSVIAAGSTTVFDFLKQYSFSSPLDIGEKGFGPLSWAAVEGNSAVIEGLLEAKANINQRTTEDISEFCLFGDAGLIPLDLAVQWNGGKDVVSQLIGAKSDIFNKTQQDHYLPIHGAALSNHPEALAVLLDHGADIESKCSKGMPPLSAASVFGRLECVELLVARKADVHSTDMMGGTALHVAAIFNNNHHIAKILVEHGANVNQLGRPPPIVIAVNALCRAMVVCGSKQNFVNHIAECACATPLAGAAYYGSAEMCQYLLEARADPMAVNARGHNAMQLACLNDHEQVITLLKSHSMQPRPSPGLRDAAAEELQHPQPVDPELITEDLECKQ